MYRQGDILLIPTSRVSGKNADTLVVAEGEATSHAHRFDTDVENIQLLADWQGNITGAVLKKSADLVHDEHDTIRIPEGSYRIIRQREYDGETTRAIAD